MPFNTHHTASCRVRTRSCPPQPTTGSTAYINASPAVSQWLSACACACHHPQALTQWQAQQEQIKAERIQQGLRSRSHRPPSAVRRVGKSLCLFVLDASVSHPSYAAPAPLRSLLWSQLLCVFHTATKSLSGFRAAMDGI